MAIPKFKDQDIINAFAYINENGVPDKYQSTKYDLVKDGKNYPPKYVIAVADHLANGTDITTDLYNAVEAKSYLSNRGYKIVEKQENYTLIITAEKITSTDDEFTIDNLSLGDNYKPIDTYFKSISGDIIRRLYSKGERRNSNQTMPRIACQIYTKDIDALSVADKENFPICRYNPNSEIICGIYPSVEEYKNSILPVLMISISTL